jgi:hypothetical protein
MNEGKEIGIIKIERRKRCFIQQRHTDIIDRPKNKPQTENGRINLEG